MNVLVIDDDRSLRKTLRLALETMGHRVTEAGDGSQALEALGHGLFDVAFLDLRLGKETGLDLLPGLLRLAPGLAVVVMTAYATIETAVEAMRRGAFDYLPKPFTPGQLRLVLDRMTHIRCLESHVEALEEQVRSVVPEADLQTREPAMRQALEVAFKAAPTEATILLLGESGTGKGVVARAIHARSGRAAAPFVTVHCPSLSAELLESELFGHAKGAFTGAVQDTAGKVAAAEGGRCSSTRSATCRWRFSRSCCGCCRRGATSASARRGRGPATSASWRRPTATCRRRPPPGRSARTCGTGST